MAHFANNEPTRRAESDQGPSGGVLPGPPALDPAFAGGRRPLRLRHGHIQFLGRDIPTPVILLALAEFLVLMGALALATNLRLPGLLPATAAAHEGLQFNALAFAAVNMVAMLSMGLYRKGAREGITGVSLRLAGALALGAAVLVVLFYLLPDTTLDRSVMGLAFGFALVGLLATRVIGVRLLQQDAFKRRVLVLGAGRKASLFNQEQYQDDREGFEVVGFVAGPSETPQIDPERVAVPAGPLVDYAQEHFVDDIVIALDDARGGFSMDDLLACKMNGIDVVDSSDFFERERGVLKLDTLRPSKMIFSRGFRQSLYRGMVKRAVDIVASAALLMLAWPLMLLAVLGILVEGGGRGSVLFRQVRIGQQGREFNLLKFRSMIMDAESDGVARWASRDDPRITRFGRFMRKTRIDELPQLFNVLRGDMSFVGPRPERPVFVKQLATRLPYYHLRHWVKPGVTGWAQINYPYGASERDALEKLQYDLYYVKNQGVALDLLIIAQTVEVVLWGRGSR
ncbi:TIGR03013 family XrtA/PEP-CTERM system glycosyltransferase [Thioalkalivibrio sp.]|uniref:TIGR03013 family XrtA/PEP-CTERM system glycosyltransferase n=1 Tax=Thioalkalivibrio sp. TaxID=2093813 RepID=UPI00397553FA